MNGRPRVEIGVYIINNSKTKVFLGKNKLELIWRLLTGRLRYSEDFDESAQKHMEEQLNLRIDRRRFNFLASFNSIDKVRKLHSIEIDFSLVIDEEEEKILMTRSKSAFQDWDWFNLEEVTQKGDDIFPGIHTFLKKNSILSVEQILTISSN